jgi:hypothetical protein
MKEDIIKWARQAAEYADTHTKDMEPNDDEWSALRDKRFAELVRADEREACAKVCDRMVMYGPVAEVQQRYNKAYADCRDAIRARGQS